MAYPLCSAPVTLNSSKPKPVSYNCFGNHIHTHQTLVHSSNHLLTLLGPRFRCLKVKAKLIKVIKARNQRVCSVMIVMEMVQSSVRSAWGMG
uniref:Uncharacterized protein n=1 Tax=Cannabis sativa TaxID=3483 RepID=A0A803QWH3_CANSA